MDTVKIGIVGLGSISGIYLENITKKFPELSLVAVYDLLKERAQQAAAEYHVPTVHDSLQAMMDDPNVEIILNLTRPCDHFEVSKAALLAGKHVYTEKPLATTLAEGEALVALAQQKGLLLGGAPDTFMGAGIQTCRKLIEDGCIGNVFGAACFMLCHGHEHWHPAPDFYYQFGGGPMMDVGPYYITALVQLLGGVHSVFGVTRSNFAQRTITSQPLFGKTINVEVPTHTMGTLYFDSGAVGTIVTSFDVYYKEKDQARFEIYGTKGTLIVPDPNLFSGEVKLMRSGQNDFETVPLAFDYPENSRGLGLADMAKALRTGRAARADHNQVLHVLEVLTSFERSNAKGGVEEIHHKYNLHQPMKNNPVHGVLDD